MRFSRTLGQQAEIYFLKFHIFTILTTNKMNRSFDIPILLVVFNRPDTALQVIRTIKKVKPKKLYIAADGPRIGKEEEIKLCQETRNTVLKEIDWDCETFTLFRENNVGCAHGVSGAISWFFQNEEMGIILEDDCVPSTSFFNFCEELLHYYRDDTRVMQISGCNIQQGTWRGSASYYFSRYAEIWGWATWKRAWDLFDFDMQHYDKFIEQGGLKNIFPDPLVEKRWKKNFEKIRNENPPSVWGYRWMYSIWKENGVSIIPNVPLVQNIGFDERAVHTKSPDNPFGKIKAGSISKIEHPKVIVPHLEADAYTTAVRHQPPLLTRAKLKMKHLAKTKLNLNL